MGTSQSTEKPLETEYDIIILGGGSAGCVLANRLSVDGKYSVLLVEAGQSSLNVLVSTLPGGYGQIFHDKRYDYDYYSVPQKHCHGRKMYQPSNNHMPDGTNCVGGKMLGGCSSINAQMYTHAKCELTAGIIVDRGSITIDGQNLRMTPHGRTTRFYPCSGSPRDSKMQRSITITSLNLPPRNTTVETVNGKSRINLTSTKFRPISFERPRRWDYRSILTLTLNRHSVSAGYRRLWTQKTRPGPTRRKLFSAPKFSHDQI